MNKPAELKLETVPVWINGKALAPAGRTGEVFNPASGQVTKKVVFADPALIDAAVKAATAALPEWRDTPPLRRARVMQKFLDLLQKNQKQLAQIVSDEHGKTLPDAMGSVQRGIEVVEFACGIPQLLKGEYSENVGTQVDTHTLRQPVGVCAGITPFNFPVMVPLWMFLHPQAFGEGALGLDPHGGAVQGSGASRRRVQRRAWRQGGRRRDPQSPGHPRRVLRGIDADCEVHL
jgi:acyl-CoA reductase-like NAD-dependent aldehyde dehydrogenase